MSADTFRLVWCWTLSCKNMYHEYLKLELKFS